MLREVLQAGDVALRKSTCIACTSPVFILQSHSKDNETCLPYTDVPPSFRVISQLHTSSSIIKALVNGTKLRSLLNYNIVMEMKQQ